MTLSGGRRFTASQVLGCGAAEFDVRAVSCSARGGSCAGGRCTGGQAEVPPRLCSSLGGLEPHRAAPGRVPGWQVGDPDVPPTKHSKEISSRNPFQWFTCSLVHFASVVDQTLRRPSSILLCFPFPLRGVRFLPDFVDLPGGVETHCAAPGRITRWQAGLPHNPCVPWHPRHP